MCVQDSAAMFLSKPTVISVYKAVVFVFLLHSANCGIVGFGFKEKYFCQSCVRLSVHMDGE